MIAYLNGILAEIEEENIVIEVNGIGYNVRIPAGMAGRLPQIGEVVKLYTYTSVREDAIGLYGFLSRDDLNMYRQLITVSGIGPKGGLSVLSAMSADELRMAGNSGSGCGSPVKGGPEKNVLKRNRQAGCFTCGRHKSAMLFSPAAA